MFKQTFFAFVASLGLNGAVAAQTTAEQTAPAQTPAMAQALAARTCPLPEIADTVPLEQAPGSDLMTVPVGINGTAQKFLLDIGLKKPTSVSPELMAKLSLPQDFRLTESFGTPGGGPFGSRELTQVRVCDLLSGLGCDAPDRVRVGSFTLGNATVQHRALQVAEPGEIARSAPYAGFMTGDVLRNYDAELDFAGKKMTWLTPTSCTDPNQVVFWSHTNVAIIPVTLAVDGRLQMQATAGGHVFNAEIDTSSPRTVMRRDIAELYAGLKSPDMVPLGDLKDGMHMQIYVHTFPELIFAGGGVRAENVPVLIQTYTMIPSRDRHVGSMIRGPGADHLPDLSIGMDVLQHLHMYVVPGQGRVYVTAAEQPNP